MSSRKSISETVSSSNQSQKPEGRENEADRGECLMAYRHSTASADRTQRFSQMCILTKTRIVCRRLSQYFPRCMVLCSWFANNFRECMYSVKLCPRTVFLRQKTAVISYANDSFIFLFLCYNIENRGRWPWTVNSYLTVQIQRTIMWGIAKLPIFLTEFRALYQTCERRGSSKSKENET